MIEERLPDHHEWVRICDADWADPLDPIFAQRHGGRWNPPGSWRTLYLNEDVLTARLNLDRFIAGWPYEPEDLDDATGPHLAIATLPRDQVVADLHGPDGLTAAGLPATYPVDDAGRWVSHATCQQVGEVVHAEGLRGIRCRSAQALDGAGRELAWFPATARSHAHLRSRLRFDEWFWG